MNRFQISQILLQLILALRLVDNPIETVSFRSGYIKKELKPFAVNERLTPTKVCFFKERT